MCTKLQHIWLETSTPFFLKIFDEFLLASIIEKKTEAIIKPYFFAEFRTYQKWKTNQFRFDLIARLHPAAIKQ